MTTRYVAVCLALSLTLGSTWAWGIYARPQLEKVPIERVLTNLLASSAEKPRDAAIKFNLARAYAMAYASKATEVELRKPDGQLWFGYEPRNVPFEVTTTDDESQQAEAEKSLSLAIETYEAALKLAPDNLVGRLGYGWCLDQAKQQEAAIKQYRQVIAEAWKTEGKMEVAGLGFHSLTAEAGEYLIPHLDQANDAKEIQAIKTATEKMRNIPRPITPIAIPLEAGLSAQEIEDRLVHVRFDADGSGQAKTWSWIKPNAGWLVYDRQGHGKIDSALQMFGNVTFWMFWENGYEPLAALDDNRDGELRGSELQHLAIWCDANQNGQSETGEVRPVSDYNVVAISVQHTADPKHPERIQHSAAGVTFADGSRRASYDLMLQPQP